MTGTPYELGHHSAAVRAAGRLLNLFFILEEFC
jgi:hypothetical protein